MMRRRLIAGALAAAATVLIAPTRPWAAPDPVAFIKDLGSKAIAVLGPQVPAAQRLNRFRELFRDDFDVPEIGRFVLGRYWRTASEQQQAEFLRLFQEYIVQAYSTRLGEYGGEPFRVIGSRQSGGEIVVTSEIQRQNGSRIAVDWYLVDRGGRYKISDVYVGGVSMKVTERDEFGAVIQRNGGQVQALIDLLRRKVAATG
jgi:phospholipid transport system substrate-binding protein